MVVVRVEGEALTWLEHYGLAGGHGIAAAVAEYFYRGICKLFILRCVVEGKMYVVTAAVDYVLHLVPVEVHGGDLTGIAHDYLFSIGLGILRIVYVAVANGDKRKAEMTEIAHAIIGNVPAQHIVPYLVVFVTLGLPFLGSPLAEGGQLKAVLLQKLFETLYYGVYLGSFHSDAFASC